MANPSLVQVAGNQTASMVNTLAQAFGSNNAAGNLLFVQVGWYNPAGTLTVSVADSLNGAVYTALTAVQGGALVVSTQGFYLLNSKVGANTVTATISGAGALFVALNILEYLPGNGVPLAFDAQNGSVVSGPSFTSASITVAQANELALNYITSGTGAGYTHGAGWTAEVPPQTASTFSMVQDMIAPMGSLAATGTAGSSLNVAAGIVAFKQGGHGGGGMNGSGLLRLLGVK